MKLSVSARSWRDRNRFRIWRRFFSATIIFVRNVVIQEEHAAEPDVGTDFVTIFVKVDLVPGRIEEHAARAGGDGGFARFGGTRFESP